MWVNASSLMIGVVLERHETVLEYACWLQPENGAQYINLVELDAVLKGINLALQCQRKVLHVKTDSVCVYSWVSNQWRFYKGAKPSPHFYKFQKFMKLISLSNFVEI